MFMARPLDSRLRRRFQNPHKILAPHVREGMTVLDFGCGPGFLTIEAAELVGERGRVIAADLQQPMLDIIAKKIAGGPLEPRVTLHRCEPNGIGLDTPVDLAVAMFVIHEVPDGTKVTKELAALVRPGGRLFLMEPKLFHVSRKAFERTVRAAEEEGLCVVDRPKVVLSWTAVLERKDEG